MNIIIIGNTIIYIGSTNISPLTSRIRPDGCRGNSLIHLTNLTGTFVDLWCWEEEGMGPFGTHHSDCGHF